MRLRKGEVNRIAVMTGLSMLWSQETHRSSSRRQSVFSAVHGKRLETKAASVRAEVKPRPIR